MLPTKTIQSLLARLGYYDGSPDGDATSANFRDDLRRFQADYGLVADGWYGPKTEAKLLPLKAAIDAAPAHIGGMRRWQLTYYYVGNVSAWSGPKVSMHLLDDKNQRSSKVMVPAGAFVEAALNGTTKLVDGRLANVAHPAYGTVDRVEFAPVYDMARRNGWIPEKVGYAGIQLTADRKYVSQARNFRISAGGPKGWPIVAKGIECDPFRTLAADNGRLPKHDARFKGKGGVVPAGTRVFILEFVGVKLPDGTTHDGWFTVNDTGGGIYGAHFDVFTGNKQLASKVKIPARAHIWFDGIESRLPMDYSYGL